MMNSEPFRLAPALPVEAYKTYAILSPKSTHTRVVSCEEFQCEHWRNGWVTRIDFSTDLGRKQIAYIEKSSNRKYTATWPDASVPIAQYDFPPGQKCFREHRVPIAREPLYVVRGGDWRGNPEGWKRQHHSARDWVDDFGEHQQQLADRIEKG